ncbi:MAG: MarR family winged helix-turn-helix transcriptional regulator [Propionibacteriaceae bacterium]|nr:MarR family winged helix-turn-helix transcriptional regulator [Propionibacteriaceae bacterium]
MGDFESKLNDLLVDTFNTILKYESRSLSTVMGVPLTIGEAHMIDCIARLEDQATVGQIAARMQLAMPTTTIAVKKLEQKGYVVKVPSDVDGRRVTVRLTEEGERIDRAHTIFHQRMVRNVASQFEPDQRDLLLTAIGQLNDFFQRQAKAG